MGNILFLSKSVKNSSSSRDESYGSSYMHPDEQSLDFLNQEDSMELLMEQLSNVKMSPLLRYCVTQAVTYTGITGWARYEDISAVVNGALTKFFPFADKEIIAGNIIMTGANKCGCITSTCSQVETKLTLGLRPFSTATRPIWTRLENVGKAVIKRIIEIDRQVQDEAAVPESGQLNFCLRRIDRLYTIPSEWNTDSSDMDMSDTSSVAR